jgi:hypothetical protein
MLKRCLQPFPAFRFIEETKDIQTPISFDDSIISTSALRFQQRWGSRPHATTEPRALTRRFGLWVMLHRIWELWSTRNFAMWGESPMCGTFMEYNGIHAA